MRASKNFAKTTLENTPPPPLPPVMTSQTSIFLREDEVVSLENEPILVGHDLLRNRANLWNSLPKEIRMTANLTAFRAK